MPVCEVVLVFVVHYQAPLILTQNHVGWCRGYRELAIAFLSEEPHVRWATPACALMYVPYAAVAQPPGVPLWTSSHAIWKLRGGSARFCFALEMLRLLKADVMHKQETHPETMEAVFSTPALLVCSMLKGTSTLVCPFMSCHAFSTSPSSLPVDPCYSITCVY